MNEMMPKHAGRLRRKPRAIGLPKLWFIDLDDTLFEASGGMLHAIHLRMNDFISKRLGISWEAAGALRTAYWSQYGSTFLGMWKNHGIDPREFLPATHDFDFRPFIQYAGDPKSDLRRVPGKRIVFQWPSQLCGCCACSAWYARLFRRRSYEFRYAAFWRLAAEAQRRHVVGRVCS